MSRLFIVFPAIALVVAFIFFGSNLVVYKSKDSASIVSPLPEFLIKRIPDVFGLETEFWKPNIVSVRRSNIQPPKISAESAIAYDLSENALLYAKNIKTRLPMASLTKIMTAIVALQTIDSKAELLVSKRAEEVGENAMGLSAGEKLRLEELLYGLMLPSGNDAAEAIAENSPFGRDNFIYFMNKKAEELGLTDTHFTNPTGLEGEGDQHSTVYDLLVITRYALRNPLFARVVSTYQYDIAATAKHKEYHLYNETNLLTSYPGIRGVKTGYTYEAGLCLISYLEYGGHKIIAILLNAQNRREEMKDLLDYSLKVLGIKHPSRL